MVSTDATRLERTPGMHWLYGIYGNYLYVSVTEFKETSLYTVQVTCSVRGWEKGYRKVSGQAVGYAFVDVWAGSRSSLATLRSRID